MTAIENRCVEEGRKLLNHGAERIMLLANTIHLVSEGIEKRCHTKLIHIVEETYREVNKSSLKHVGLIGTAYTMQSGMYEVYFKPRGINLSVPKKEDQDIIHNIIYQELIKGVFLETSRQAILKIIDNMNVEGIILGCTELPMLIKEEDLQIKRYDTMMIHAKAAAEWMLQDE
jgi:aspartate racemase